MAKELLKRSEQKVEDTWDLSDIYATTADFDKDVENLIALSDKAAGFKGRMFENSKTFLECMKTWEAMNMTLYKAFEYAQRLSDQDTKNTENLARLGKLEAIEVEIGSKTAFFDPELIAGDDETLKKYYEEEPELKEFEIYINNSRRLKPHMLSEELENLMALAGEVRSNPQNIFSLFNNADLVFPEIEDENGEKVRISHGRFIPLMESSNRRVRKDAFEALYSTYEQFQNSIAAMYQGQVKQLIFNAKARKYNSILEAALNVTNVDPKVYKNLIEAVNDNMDKMYKYVALRKKLLGVDELHMYDVYTPIVKDVSVDIPFEQAKETVLKALAPLGERYISLLKEGFDNRWIDVYENEGKRSGAYSAGVYGVHPYVLLNYNNTLDNQFTLAHEMGHSLHSYFTDEAQNFFNSHYKIFVAEVASTVNEVLLMEYLLKVTTDKNQKAYLLNHYLDSFKGTVYRQTMFAEFEMLTAELAEKGESLNAETLRKTYYELNKKYFGKNVVVDDRIKYEWMRIPHFYYNFYVYKYATGLASACYIVDGILNKKEGALDNYLKFLTLGGSKYPVDELKVAGVDISDPKVIESAISMFNDTIDEFKKLLEEK